MVEATEEVIKVYLEQKGYLVTLSKKVDAKTHNSSPRAELDIIDTTKKINQIIDWIENHSKEGKCLK